MSDILERLDSHKEAWNLPCDIYELLDDAADEIQRLKSPWIPVTDEPLPYDTLILVAVKLASGRWYITTAIASDESGELENVDGEVIGYQSIDVDYWMPLLEPLQQEQENE